MLLKVSNPSILKYFNNKLTKIDVKYLSHNIDIIILLNLQPIIIFFSAEIEEVATSSGSNTASKSFVSQSTQTFEANYVSTQANDSGNFYLYSCTLRHWA